MNPADGAGVAAPAMEAGCMGGIFVEGVGAGAVEDTGVTSVALAGTDGEGEGMTPMSVFMSTTISLRASVSLWFGISSDFILAFTTALALELAVALAFKCEALLLFVLLAVVDMLPETEAVGAIAMRLMTFQ